MLSHSAPTRLLNQVPLGAEINVKLPSDDTATHPIRYELQQREIRLREIAKKTKKRRLTL